MQLYKNSLKHLRLSKVVCVGRQASKSQWIKITSNLVQSTKVFKKCFSESLTVFYLQYFHSNKLWAFCRFIWILLCYKIVNSYKIQFKVSYTMQHVVITLRNDKNMNTFTWVRKLGIGKVI